MDLAHCKCILQTLWQPLKNKRKGITDIREKRKWNKIKFLINIIEDFKGVEDRGEGRRRKRKERRQEGRKEKE